MTALEGLHAGAATELAERLQLQRPLAFLDLETTGTKVTSDRIVEIAVLKLFPDGAADIRTQRLNPGIPISAEATAVHGITDQDVRDKPEFSAFAPALFEFLDDCDLAGFGVAGFDLKLLEAEFGRTGIEFNWRDRSVVDAMSIFFDREPRNLSAALRFYCGRGALPTHPLQRRARRYGRLIWVDGVASLGFGKHKGRSVADLLANDPEPRSSLGDETAPR